MVVELVAVLVLTVSLALLLNGVVGQVDKLVLCIVCVVVVTASSDVPLLVPVAL